MNCPEHWTHIISTDVRVKSHCKEFPVNKGTCTRLSMSGSSIFAVLVTHLAFWSGLSAADFPLFSGQMCPPLSSKTKTCGSVLAHYLFVKMHLCQSLAMHIPLCVFMISSATHTLCPPPKLLPCHLYRKLADFYRLTDPERKMLYFTHLASAQNS